jgi:asparagine synthase (glutamine-hydrolysing)
MCGIAGFIVPPESFGLESANAVLQKQGLSIAHRGPDHAQTWFEPSLGVGFVHQRLAIVDLTPEGHQPKTSHCGRYTVVFNGEIYNFKELRIELEGKGHAFKGSSDTEVMLTAFTEYGVRPAIEKLVGMFAFVVLDHRDRKVLLVRDRIGKKPLYYSHSNAGLVFGSELRALKAFPEFRKVIRSESFALFMQMGALPAPWTIYENVQQLQPGMLAEFSLDHRAEPPTLQTYWSMSEVAQRGFENPFEGGFESALHTLDQLITEATRVRMQMDVPWGAFLSGGIDSSLVVSQMQKQSSTPVRTFTIGYESKAFDESQHAELVAKHLGTRHTTLLVTPQDALDLIPKLPQICDEPLADGSLLPTYLVSKLTRQHVTVALSGDGGDEFFGGYHRHYLASRLELAQKYLPSFVQKGLGLFSPLCARLLKNDRLDRVLRLIETKDPAELYRQIVFHWGLPPRFFTRPFQPSTQALWPVAQYTSPRLAEQFMIRDAIRFLVDDVMVKVDRASMSVALETRAPLLDHRIVEFAWRLPLEFKVQNGHGKHILRELLYRYVPKALVDRPKMGFGVPLSDWLVGPLRPWAESLLSEQALLRSGLIHPPSARAVWNEFLMGKRNRLSVVWATLMFQAWYEEQ